MKLLCVPKQPPECDSRIRLVQTPSLPACVWWRITWSACFEDRLNISLATPDYPVASLTKEIQLLCLVFVYRSALVEPPSIFIHSQG